eukprot:3608978-Lingulodinium_polyedra.AAC.1
MERASVWFANRCGNGTATQPRHSATFHRNCARTRSNRRFAAAATAHKSHARAIHARTGFRPA